MSNNNSFLQVIAKLDDISTQLENLQNALSQNTNFLTYSHQRSTMEQRISSIDETLIQNPIMMPPTSQTNVPRPKVVKTLSDTAKEEVQVMNIEKDRLFG